MHRSTPSFGRSIRQRRKALDLTQAALARQVGCAEITIRKIEADEIRPSREFLARLADQLGIDENEQAAFVATGRGTSTERSDNLPTPPNPLIGRDRELATAKSRLATDNVRLLTLTGPGGAGKTRLALQIGHDLAATFRDGVCFVPLAAISDPDLVGVAIGQALALDGQNDALPVEHLVAFLRDKALLLILDNFEQVVAGAPLVATLLARCPDLRVLATSRIALHLSGEHELAVPPLALPVRRAAHANLSAFPAIALFVARARAVRADFALTPGNAPVIADICARLDGLPLAIELAAAWIKLLTPDALLVRLSGPQPLHLLAGGPRDLPPRHQTLRNAVGWSYDLLAPAEQRLFRTLGVCVGGCTLEVAEALADMTDVLPTLAALVGSSLLRHDVERDGQGRVTMLETIREYALELLATTGERDAVRQRHAQVFLAQAEAAQPHLLDSEQAAWLEQLEADHDNIRAALEWSRSPGGDPALGVRLAGALWEFWLVRGHISEGRATIAALLAHDHTPSPERARLLNGAGRLAWAQNDWQQATALLQNSQTLFDQLGDRAGCAAALNYLGEVAEAQGAYHEAATLFAQSLDLFEQIGDREGSAAVLVSYGQMMQAQGQHERAAELVAASQTLFEQLGDRRGLAVSLTVQGQAMNMLGDYARANQLFERSLDLFNSLGYRHGVGWALTNQGQTAMLQQQHARAEQLFAESLELYEELGDRRGHAWAMANQGHAAEQRGDRKRALVLLERSVALFDALGDNRGYAWALFYVGESRCSLGQYRQSIAHFIESVHIFAELDDTLFSSQCLAGMARACAGLGHKRVAVRLFAAADAIRSLSIAHGAASDPAAHVDALRQALGETVFAAEWAAGQALSAVDASALAQGCAQ